MNITGQNSIINPINDVYIKINNVILNDSTSSYIINTTIPNDNPYIYTDYVIP